MVLTGLLLHKSKPWFEPKLLFSGLDRRLKVRCYCGLIVKLRLQVFHYEVYDQFNQLIPLVLVEPARAAACAQISIDWLRLIGNCLSASKIAASSSTPIGTLFPLCQLMFRNEVYDQLISQPIGSRPLFQSFELDFPSSRHILRCRVGIDREREQLLRRKAKCALA